MIKIISTDCEEDAKKIWAKLKKEVDKSTIMKVEFERIVADITDDFGIVRHHMYTGEFEIKVRCMKK